MQDLSKFGEIARLDVSFADPHGTMLVTYFDVRRAQIALLRMASRAELFQPALHDCRIVSVDFPNFCAKTGHTGGFEDFGEVAHVSMLAGQVVVEFYDLRSARALLAAAGDCATPVPRGASVPSAIETRGLLEGVTTQLLAPPGTGHPAAAAAEADPQSSGGIPDSVSQQADDDVAKHCAARSKVTSKRFQKFDINPGAILRGEDTRTSVMVRHLQGFCARRDFVLFLDRCGLGDRHSFLYMPCREHRNIQAGLAFVNFASPLDVHTLCSAAASRLWREVCGSSPTTSLAVSYSRFQGHEDLMQHFSLSGVLQEQDPETFAIFRPKVLNQSTSVHDPVKTKKALRIPGPLGIAEDAEVPNHADPMAEGGVSAGKLALCEQTLPLTDAIARLLARSLKEADNRAPTAAAEKVETAACPSRHLPHPPLRQKR
jgi:hypothetical protein